MLGFVLSYAGTWLRDWVTLRRERRGLAATLLVEVFSQGAWCVQRGARWNANALAGGKVSLQQAIDSRPPPAAVYIGCVGQMPKLEPRVASSIAAFHGSVDLVRDYIDNWRHASLSTTLSSTQVQDLARLWQRAALNAHLALKALDEVADVERLPNDEAEIAQLLTDLELVADGRHPTLSGQP